MSSMLSTEKEKEMWRWIISLMNEWTGVSLGSGKSGEEEKSWRLYQ